MANLRGPTGLDAKERAMHRETGLSQLLDELVSAIELRDGSDTDSHDWAIDARIRVLERRLVELHRSERAITVMVERDDERAALAGMF
jgi:hypothetical protein